MVIGVSGDCKVVIVVPRELDMSPGKMGSQCAHAAVGMYRVWIPSWFVQLLCAQLCN